MLKSFLTAPNRAAQKHLIVNADDFGLSDETNRGIIQCRQHGVLTSASLMVRAPAATGAAEYASEDPALSMGLHIELGEWDLHEDQWVQTQFVVPLDNPAAVRGEIYRQLDAFRKLTGRDPTHLDSHQHVHQQEESVKVLMLELAREMGIVLRGDSPTVRFWGAFFGQDQHQQPMRENITSANLLRLLDNLPPGITELSCHPGLDDALNSTYCAERLLEVQTLCDPRIRLAIENRGIRLIGFSSVSDLVNLGALY